MINRLKNVDTFTKNIIFVFAGTCLYNFLNLLYQLLIAHKLSAAEFASFNSLLAIFMVIAAPLSTIPMAVAKYSAEFNARNQIAKVKFLLSDLSKKSFIFSVFTLLIFWLFSASIINILKIPSVLSGYILAVLLASTWITSVFTGGVQGLEFFGWLTSANIVSSVLKLALAFIFILLGYNIAGALGALLFSSLAGIIILYYPLRRFIYLKAPKEEVNPVRDITNPANQIILSNGVNYKEILSYLFPLALSNLCFITLVSFDMVLVKYFFPQNDSGLYALAQMTGKIFLFFPSAVGLVMFPRASGLNAKNMDTLSTLKRSLLYVLGLCIFAAVLYNLFPSLFL